MAGGHDTKLFGNKIEVITFYLNNTKDYNRNESISQNKSPVLEVLSRYRCTQGKKFVPIKPILFGMKRALFIMESIRKD